MIKRTKAGLAVVPLMRVKLLITVFTRPQLLGEVRGMEVEYAET